MKIFQYVPVVVMIYASSMLLSSLGFFEFNDEVNALYKTLKSNLLPAMLFLMLLQIDFTHFVKLGKKLLISYVLAVVSIAISFIIVVFLFHFPSDIRAAFGALAGSWMGGTANMIAVGSALGVSESSFSYALVVDSINYTLWVMFLLFLVPYAHFFNRFTKSEEQFMQIGEIGCACNMGVKRYWFFVLLSIIVALFVNTVASYFTVVSHTTTIVLFATLLGILGSLSRVKNINGSSEVANSMLYLIIALIGSKAAIENFSTLGTYIAAGFFILLVHALLMVLGAKIFKLDLFSIGVASLANIGGIASAPILAAAYDKSLVSIGILMAVMGYLLGTVGGLFVANILLHF